MKIQDWTPFAWLIVALVLTAVMGSGCATTGGGSDTIINNPSFTVEVGCEGYMPRDCALKQVDATNEGIQRDGEWVSCARISDINLSRSVSSMEARNMAVTAKCGKVTTTFPLNSDVPQGQETKTVSEGAIYGSTVRYGRSVSWTCARLTVGPIVCDKQKLGSLDVTPSGVVIW